MELSVLQPKGGAECSGDLEGDEIARDNTRESTPAACRVRGTDCVPVTSLATFCVIVKWLPCVPFFY